LAPVEKAKEGTQGTALWVLKKKNERGGGQSNKRKSQKELGWKAKNASTTMRAPGGRSVHELLFRVKNWEKKGFAENLKKGTRAKTKRRESTHCEGGETTKGRGKEQGGSTKGIATRHGGAQPKD